MQIIDNPSKAAKAVDSPNKPCILNSKYTDWENSIPAIVIGIRLKNIINANIKENIAKNTTTFDKLLIQ
mgnify:CR=1 FL=1